MGLDRSTDDIVDSIETLHDLFPISGYPDAMNGKTVEHEHKSRLTGGQRARHCEVLGLNTDTAWYEAMSWHSNWRQRPPPNKSILEDPHEGTSSHRLLHSALRKEATKLF